MTRMLTMSLIAAVTAAAASSALAQHTLRIGMVTVNDAQHTFANRYAEELGKRTKGALTVKVFPAAQLGSIPRQIENLKIGAQGGFLGPAGFLSGITKAFQVTDAPGIYKSYWHAQNAVTDPKFRDTFLNLAKDNGIVGVSIFNYGPQAIATHKPIKRLADLKGLKIRVLATKMESRVAGVLGATGVPMPFTEVLPALQQRTIDGCRSSAAVMAASKFYTATKNIALTQQGMIISALWISTKWLAKMPKDVQDAIKTVGRELETWAGHNAAGFEARATKIWKDNGAQVVQLPAEDVAEMKRRLAPLGDEFLGQDPVTKDVFALLKGAVARASDKAPPQ